MDATRILGGLLANRTGRTRGNGQILGQVLNGVAAITEAANQGHRFPPAHHAPLESIVRDSVYRHHHRGGRFPPAADQWIRAQPVQRVPKPRHDHDQHHSGRNYAQRAELLITAMVMAAQADGQLDQAEQDQIIQQLQPLDRAEADFLRRQFARRHDMEAFVHEIPNGMEYEVYSISLMAINLDTNAEARYLRALGECMRLQPHEVNAIHQRLGAPLLY